MPVAIEATGMVREEDQARLENAAEHQDQHVNDEKFEQAVKETTLKGCFRGIRGFHCVAREQSSLVRSCATGRIAWRTDERLSTLALTSVATVRFLFWGTIFLRSP
jgi:hypothetical protein